MKEGGIAGKSEGAGEERKEGGEEGREGGKEPPLSLHAHSQNKDVSVYLPSPRLACLLTKSTEKVTHRLFSPTSVNAFYLHCQGRQHQPPRYTRPALHTHRRGREEGTEK